MTPRKNASALSDRYELQEQLGAGGMAEVFLGRDRVLGRTVAVKTLLSAYSGDPHFIERFRREAQNAAALNHPNIVGVYDTGDDDGTHYIVMEYVEGRTLREVIREEGPLLPERAAEIAADVCAGLAFAHQHGIVHRDIKPANIMITGRGMVKVADFGIARAMSGDTVTQTAMVLGTAQYFSPEQAQSAPVDARSDLYSLGVVLYEMLTRQVPFTGSSPVAIAYKHVKEPPTPPSRLNPDVPAPLEAIVLKALAKNPDNRYQSSDEMREDLLRALHGQPVEATPVLSDATGMIDLSSDETQIVERRPTMPGYKHERTPEEKRRRTGILLLGAILAAIVGVAAWAVLGLIGGTKIARVPDVLGERLSVAEARIEAEGFDVDLLDPQFSDKYPAGTVMAMNPTPGTELTKGDTVTLTPSAGIERVKVPDVLGKSEAEAKRILEAAGLKIGEVTHENSERRFGTVIDQRPGANTEVAKGSTATLVVSKGRESATIPDVRGRFADDAAARLEGAGFDVIIIEEEQNPDCAVEVGRVCRQSPEGGTTRAKGSNVTIWVAKQPAEESPSPSPLPLPSETASPSPSPTSS